MVAPLAERVLCPRGSSARGGQKGTGRGRRGRTGGDEQRHPEGEAPQEVNGQSARPGRAARGGGENTATRPRILAKSGLKITNEPRRRRRDAPAITASSSNQDHAQTIEHHLHGGESKARLGHSTRD